MNFKSSSVHGGLIAQSVEHRPFKAVVPGSSPGQPTIFFDNGKNLDKGAVKNGEGV